MTSVAAWPEFSERMRGTISAGGGKGRANDAVSTLTLSAPPPTERFRKLVHGVLLEAGRGSAKGTDAVRELHLHSSCARHEAPILAKNLVVRLCTYGNAGVGV